MSEADYMEDGEDYRRICGPDIDDEDDVPNCNRLTCSGCLASGMCLFERD